MPRSTARGFEPHSLLVQIKIVFVYLLCVTLSNLDWRTCQSKSLVFCLICCTRFYQIALCFQIPILIFLFAVNNLIQVSFFDTCSNQLSYQDPSTLSGARTHDYEINNPFFVFAVWNFIKTHFLRSCATITLTRILLFIRINFVASEGIEPPPRMYEIKRYNCCLSFYTGYWGINPTA